MKIIKVIFVLFILFSFNLYSQLSANNVEGYVGEDVDIGIKYNGGFLHNQETILSAYMFLSNPTVFYPLHFYSGNNTSIIQESIIKISDSTYKIAMILNFNDNYKKNEIAFKLKGKLLAGNDSVCIINFNNIKVDDSILNDFSLLLKSSSVSGFINYIRFPKIIEYYPNPVYIGGKINLVYNIDKNSTVKFYLYDLEMKRKLIKNLGIVQKGFNYFDFILDNNFSAGAYWIGLETNSGFIYKNFLLIK